MWRLHLAVCLLAAAAPFWWRAIRPPARSAPEGFPGWPAAFEGRPLRATPLTERERGVLDGFPGRMGRFTDGRREIILRWIATPTAHVHEAARCLQASGGRVGVPKLWRDADGAMWSRYEAQRGGERLRVRERIRDEAGGAWTDVSAWWWAAMLGKTTGPWWAVTVAEVASEPRDPPAAPR